jgi:hypothetical protein
LFIHIEGAFGRGGGRGGGKIIGHNITGESSDLGLSPALIAVFALTIVIALITLYQLERALVRFKHLTLPEGEPRLPYDVGTLFRVFLASYTAIFFVNNVLYAVYIAAFGGTFFLPSTFQIGVAFTGQLSLVLFYATLLSVIVYRQRVQLNPEEKQFNLKTFLDGLLLVTILILGVAEDGIVGTSTAHESKVAVANISLAFQVFGFLASLDVAISAFMARVRLSQAGIQDKVCGTEKYIFSDAYLFSNKIINISAFAVSLIVVIGGIYGIISIAIRRNASPFFDGDALLIATVVIEGIVSIAAIGCCLLMGAPPKPPKTIGKEGVVGEKA